ncbi:MAG TPA: hypothetical protein DEP84_22605 [Chloroflexi bacterium]|nr:hypothetical protein [Chloroflexota bacterium]
MTYLNVEEYRVRLSREGEMLPGAVWVRESREWELEAGEVHRVAAATSEAESGPELFFHRMVETLEHENLWLRTCGTCIYLRRSAEEGAVESGWSGFCNYSAPESFEKGSEPGVVSVLAADCHHFEYRQGEPLPADALLGGADEVRLPDPETTLPIRTRTVEEKGGLLGAIKKLFSGGSEEKPRVPTGIIERPGGQPCPVCGTRMTNRASITNATPEGDERVFSVWRCPNCHCNCLDDWLEAYVGSKARDAERLYVVPPSEADVAVDKVGQCPRPDIKGCTCVSNQWFEAWGDRLLEKGRRIQHRESVVSL